MAKNKTAQLFLISGWAILVTAGVVLAWFWKTLPPQLPWFYSLPMGEQQLISRELLVIILATTAVFFGFTRLIARWAGKGDIPVETTIMAGVWVAIILLVLSFFRVMNIFAL